MPVLTLGPVPAQTAAKTTMESFHPHLFNPLF
jgi:hypothetical protein